MKTSPLRKQFGEKLAAMRHGLRNEKYQNRGPSLRQFAQDSGVAFSMIGALELGKRSVGEKVLRKLAAALGLDEKATEEFVLEGLNTAEKDRVVSTMRDFPVEFLHAVPIQVCKFSYVDFDPIQVQEITAAPGTGRDEAQGGPDLVWRMADGSWFAVEIKVGQGKTREEALEKLARTQGKKKAGGQGKVKKEEPRG